MLQLCKYLQPGGFNSSFALKVPFFKGEATQAKHDFFSDFVWPSSRVVSAVFLKRAAAFCVLLPLTDPPSRPGSGNQGYSIPNNLRNQPSNATLVRKSSRLIFRTKPSDQAPKILHY